MTDEKSSQHPLFGSDLFRTGEKTRVAFVVTLSKSVRPFALFPLKKIIGKKSKLFFIWQLCQRIPEPAQ